MVRAEPPAVEVVGVLEQGPGRAQLPTCRQVRPRGMEQPAHLEDDVVEPAGGIGGGQNVRQERSPRRGLRVGRCRGPQEPDGGSGPVAGPAATDDQFRRGRVQLHGVAVDPGQPSPTGDRGLVGESCASPFVLGSASRDSGTGSGPSQASAATRFHAPGSSVESWSRAMLQVAAATPPVAGSRSVSIRRKESMLIPVSASVAPATSTACGTSSSAAATRSASTAGSAGQRDWSTATDSSRSNRPTATAVACRVPCRVVRRDQHVAGAARQEPGQLPPASRIVEDQQPATSAPQRGEHSVRRLLGAVGRCRQTEGLGQLRQSVGDKRRVRRRDPPGDVVLVAPPVHELDHRGCRAQARRPAGGTQYRDPAVAHRGAHRCEQPVARRGVLVAAGDVPRRAHFPRRRGPRAPPPVRRALRTATHAGTAATSSIRPMTKPTVRLTKPRSNPLRRRSGHDGIGRDRTLRGVGAHDHLAGSTSGLGKVTR